MKQYKTLLFDMDGTVIDTDPLLKESFHILYDKYRDGVYTPDEEIFYLDFSQRIPKFRIRFYF